MPYAPWGGNFSLYNYNLPLGNNTGGGSGGGGTPPSFGGYNVSPSPTSGQGPYGMVPGQIGIPPSTYSQTIGALPGLGPAGTQATNNIMNELQGQISPQALRNIQDAAARFGVSSGMPGSNAMPGTLAMNANLLGNYRTTEQLQQQGLQNYANVLGAVGQQQINPALAAEIAAHNAQLGAAPNPQAAAQQQLANYWAALAATRSLGLRGGGGGGGYGFDPAGGTGRYSSPPFDPSQYGFGFNTLGQQGGTTSRFAPPINYGPDQLYPGTELTGQPNLSSLLGPVNPYYGGGGPIQTDDYTFESDYGSPPVDYNWLNYIDEGGF